MKKNTIAKQVIIRLVILGVVLLAGVSVIASLQYYRKMITDSTALAYSYAAVASLQISGELAEKVIANGERIYEIDRAANSPGKTAAFSEEDKKLYDDWDRITSLMVGAIYINDKMGAFQVIVPDGEEAVCFWYEDARRKISESPLFRRPLREGEFEYLDMIKTGMKEEDLDSDNLMNLVLTDDDNQFMGTAIFPVFDSQRRVIAYAELDIVLSDLRTAIFHLVLSIVGLFLVILAAALIMHFYFLRKRVIRPIDQLEAAADGVVDKLKNGEAAQKLEIHTGNEIESLATSFESMTEHLWDYIEENSAITAERERMNAELNLAAGIQLDMLPSVFPAFPDRTEFDLYASMTPAKEVGGDFYDFFLIDENTLALVIADVSGKGVPASLFMMKSMLMIEDLSAQTQSPAAILGSLNNRLCNNNESDMFVTVWLGILDIKTGHLKAANAGHEYPILKQPEGVFVLFKDPHSFVAGGKKNISYKEYEMQLLPGSTLFLYTDGLPEIRNPEEEMFRIDRALETLNEDTGRTPEKLLQDVSETVRGFVQDAEPFDDLTMLCIRYNGASAADHAALVFEEQIEVEAAVESIPKVTSYLGNALLSAGCPKKIVKQIQLAVEELFANISMYGYAGNAGQEQKPDTATVKLKITKDPNEAVITLSDRGIPFDPLGKKDPNVTLPANKRKPGGLGIYISKKFMNQMRYEYKNGQNVLTISKLF